MGNRTPLRMAALQQFTDKTEKFLIGPLFNKILPLLMQPILEDEERHLLMKVIDRVLYKLDEQPSIDEDCYDHVEGREIILYYRRVTRLKTGILPLFFLQFLHHASLKTNVRLARSQPTVM